MTSSLARGTADPAVAIGLGRFFCTPPSLAVGCLGWLGQSRAWIATFNYAGYFAGSLAASRG
ncbi:YbfB/YjiJ family MFS transporter [Corynebacterium macginleyi]|uniref:YbfB/YjiJ family MFS transporter n=1 Tax=Corynebacterium macginleyi TaxID=38290 RepID=UPI002D7F47EC|nr:YbfB/YjiJ family MFS transporter [Corynebacterium macginleyi]